MLKVYFVEQGVRCFWFDESKVVCRFRAALPCIERISFRFLYPEMVVLILLSQGG